VVAVKVGNEFLLVLTMKAEAHAHNLAQSISLLQSPQHRVGASLSRIRQCLNVDVHDGLQRMGHAVPEAAVRSAAMALLQPSGTHPANSTDGS
jgi:hypothetical protein